MAQFLVTAGNTVAPIDRVRGITNGFTGRTGAAIAVAANQRGHAVTLLTSHPDTVAAHPEVRCVPYRTFDELRDRLAAHIASDRPAVIVHTAAVSDYASAGIYAPAAGTHFDQATWHGTPPTLVDRTAGKVKSDEPELWLRLVRTPKLVDWIRSKWQFRGILVKFKLEVDTSEAELLAIAERSRRQSQADWMVANTLDGAAVCAYLGSAHGYERIDRAALAGRLLDAIERQLAEEPHG